MWRRWWIRLRLRLLWRGRGRASGSGFRGCSRVSGGIDVGVEGGFAERIREKSPGVGDEAGGVGEGERAGAVGVGAVEEQGEAAVVGVHDVGVAGGGERGVEAEDGVRVGESGGKAPALGGEEDVGGGGQVVGAGGARVVGEGLRDELLAALDVARHQELLRHAHPPLGGAPRRFGRRRIHGLAAVGGTLCEREQGI